MIRIELTYCTFCSKPARDVRYIVQTNNNNGVGICDECVKVAQEIIDEHDLKEKK